LNQDQVPPVPTRRPITEYLRKGGKLEIVQLTANHRTILLLRHNRMVAAVSWCDGRINPLARTEPWT
jgi:hypothetical protein